MVALYQPDALPERSFREPGTSPIGWFFTFIVPVLLAVNVPANMMVKSVEDPWLIGYALAATVILLLASRGFFRVRPGRYRMAQ